MRAGEGFPTTLAEKSVRGRHRARPAAQNRSDGSQPAYSDAAGIDGYECPINLDSDYNLFDDIIFSVHDEAIMYPSPFDEFMTFDRDGATCAT